MSKCQLGGGGQCGNFSAGAAKNNLCNSHYKQSLAAPVVCADPTCNKPAASNSKKLCADCYMESNETVGALTGQPRLCTQSGCVTVVSGEASKCSAHSCKIGGCNNFPSKNGICNFHIRNGASTAETSTKDPKLCKVNSCSNFAAKEGRCNRCIAQGRHQDTGISSSSGHTPGAGDQKQNAETKTQSVKKPPQERLADKLLELKQRDDQRTKEITPKIAVFSDILTRLLAQFHSNAGQNSSALTELVEELILKVQFAHSNHGYSLVATGCQDEHIVDIASCLALNVQVDHVTDHLAKLSSVLRTTGRFTAFVQAATAVSNIILSDLNDTNASQGIEVLFDYLLGYAYSPDLFLAVLPAMLRNLRRFEQRIRTNSTKVTATTEQETETAETAAAAGEEEEEEVKEVANTKAAAVDSDHAGEIASLLRCLKLQFPWFETLNTFLDARLKPYPQAPRSVLDARLAKCEWKHSSNSNEEDSKTKDVISELSKRWVEGDWHAEQNQGNFQVTLQAGLKKGKRLKGKFSAQTSSSIFNNSYYSIGAQVLFLRDQKRFGVYTKGVIAQKRQQQYRVQVGNTTLWLAADRVIPALAVNRITPRMRVLCSLGADNDKYGLAAVTSSSAAADGTVSLCIETDGKIFEAVPVSSLFYAVQTVQHQGDALLDAIWVSNEENAREARGRWKPTGGVNEGAALLRLTDTHAFLGRLTPPNTSDDTFSTVIGVKQQLLDSTAATTFPIKETLSSSYVVLLQASQEQYLNLGCSAGFMLNAGPFTLEATISVTEAPAEGTTGMVLSVKDKRYSSIYGWTLAVNPDLTVSFKRTKTSIKLELNTPTKIVICSDGKLARIKLIPVASGLAVYEADYASAEEHCTVLHDLGAFLPLICGASLSNGKPENFFSGFVSEVAVWSIQSPPDHPAGLEVGLEGYWPLVSPVKLSADVSVHGHHAVPHSKVCPVLPSADVWISPQGDQKTASSRSAFNDTWLTTGNVTADSDTGVLSAVQGGAVWLRPKVDLTKKLQVMVELTSLETSQELSFKLFGRELYELNSGSSNGSSITVAVSLDKEYFSATLTVDPRLSAQQPTFHGQSTPTQTVFCTNMSLHGAKVVEFNYDPLSKHVLLNVDGASFSQEINVSGLVSLSPYVHVGVFGTFQATELTVEQTESGNGAVETKTTVVVDNVDSKIEQIPVPSEEEHLICQTLGLQLSILDECTRLSSHKPSWEWERVHWRQQLVSNSSASTVEGIALALVQFERSLVIQSNKWADSAREAWAAPLLSVETRSVVTLVDQMLELEANCPDTLFWSPWKGRSDASKVGQATIYDGKTMFRDSIRRCKFDMQQLTAVTQLKALKVQFPTIPEHILQETLQDASYNDGRLVTLLLNRTNARLEGLVADEPFVDANQQDGKTSPFAGLWATNRGTLSFAEAAPFLGVLGQATAMTNDSLQTGMATIESGQLEGFFYLSSQSHWKFDGVYVNESAPEIRAPVPSEISFMKDKFSARFNFRSLAGRKQLAENEDATLRGYSGLINNGNTCYQNSFLQCLFATHTLRRCLLASDFVADAAAITTTMETKTVDTTVDSKESASEEARESDENSKAVTAAKKVSQGLQKVFGFMQLTTRSATSQKNLQQILVPPYNGGQQQDCYQYGQYLLNQLELGIVAPEADSVDIAADPTEEESLPAYSAVAEEAKEGAAVEEEESKDAPEEAAHTSVVHDLFGGTIRNVIRCHDCGDARHQDEPFTDIGISFPKKYSAITDVCVITGDNPNIAAPPGFERLPRSTNSGRRNAVYTYICVSRTPSENVRPITTVAVVESKQYPITLSDKNSAFVVLDGNLNTGSVNVLQLAVARQAGHSPVTDIRVHVELENAKDSKSKAIAAPDGFVRLTPNLNKGTEGSVLKLCLARSLAIREVTIVNAPDLKSAKKAGPPGFDFLSRNINILASSPQDGALYVAYTSGGDKLPITSIKSRIVDKGGLANRMTIAARTAVNAGEPSTEETVAYRVGSVDMELVIERGNGCPINNLEVFLPPHSIPKYGSRTSVHLVPPSHVGESKDATPQSSSALSSHPWTVTSANQSPSCLTFEPRSSKSVVVDMWEVEGSYAVTTARKGRLTKAILSKVATKNALGFSKSHEWHLDGLWIEAQEKGWNPFHFVFDAELNSFDGYWSSAQKRAAWQGTRNVMKLLDDSKSIASEAMRKSFHPIVNVIVLCGDVAVPAGYTVIDKSKSSGRSANLNYESKGPVLHLAYATADVCLDDFTNEVQGPIAEIVVLYGNGVEPVPDGWETVQMHVPKSHKVSDQIVTALDASTNMINANTNFGSDGPTMLVCVRRAKPTITESVDELDTKTSVVSYDGKFLSDVIIAFQPSLTPHGYTRVGTTPASLPADVNQGAGGSSPAKAMFLEYKTIQVGKRTTEQDLENARERAHAIEGVWNTNEGEMNIRTIRKLSGYTVKGSIVDGNGHVSPLHGSVVTDKKNILQMYGYFQHPTWKYEQPIQFAFDETRQAFTGSYIYEEMPALNLKQERKITGSKNSYALLAFQQDFTTRLREGKTMFSSIASNHNLQSMLDIELSSEVLAGDNQVTCDTCKKRTIADKASYITKPPKHLIACVKRFRQDYRTGKTTKVLDNVQLASTLKLPTINADPKLMDIVFDGKIQEWKQVLNARYGLYAVIVHRGSRLTGGHYYAYTRDSDADLSQIDDAVLAPWVCMNDAKLTVTSWDKLNESTATSMDDTAYMLMYRLLEADELPDAHLGPNPLLRTNSEMVRTVLANKHNNTNQINPSVALEVMEDNTAYVKEVMANSSDLFLSHAHAVVRQNANYHEPLLAGVDTKANFDRSGVEAGACVLCLSPEHEAEACPFSQYTMAECPDCCVQVLKIFQDQHNSICLKRNTN